MSEKDMRCLSCMQEYEGDICPHCGYPEKDPNGVHQLPVGTMIRDRYQIGKVLGQGGFGITYLSWDTLMNAPVAVKEFFPSGTVFRRSSETTQVECSTTEMAPHFAYSKSRFLREASALVKFKDLPAVVDIIDFLEENNTAYIVMEYIQGMDLAKYIGLKGGCLSVEETFRLMRPVMEALVVVHKNDIIHRDISPDNIMVDGDGNVKLLDFGAVRLVVDPGVDKGLSVSTEAIIKHGFAPLEQYNSRGSLGPWTDIYALCATIWYCLTGTVPEEVPIRMAEGIDPDWSQIAGLTKRQQEALQKGIACRAKDRYPNVSELMGDLFGSKVTRKKKKEDRDRPVVGIVALCVIAIAVAAVIFMPKIRYNIALKALEEGRFEQAMTGFEALGTYQDSVEMVYRVNHAWGVALQEAGDPMGAAMKFRDAEYYSDSEDRLLNCYYDWGSMLMDAGNYEEAIVQFRSAKSYGDSSDKIRESYHLWGLQLLDHGAWQEAMSCFRSAEDYGNSAELILECNYRWGCALLEQDDHAGALEKFEGLKRYKDAPEMIGRCYYEWAEALERDGKSAEAAQMFGRCLAYADAWDRSLALWSDITVHDTIGAGSVHTVALKTDGTLYVAGNNLYGECNVSQWTNIIAVSCGYNHTVALHATGMVSAVGKNLNGQCNVSGWSGIVAISAGYDHTVGLRADGTVVAVGNNNLGQCEVSEWTDIVAVSAGWNITVGLRTDGTVVAAGKVGKLDLDGWTDIVEVEAGDVYVIAIKADGTPLATGVNSHGRCNVGEWKDLTDIDAGINHTVGSRSDGTVVAVGYTGNLRCNVSGWKDVVDVCVGKAHTVGLRSDGTLLVIGDVSDGQGRVGAWTDIRLPRGA